MRFPPLRGLIDRRILVNFRIDAVAFDNALLMEQIGHEWHSVEGICPSGPA